MESLFIFLFPLVIGVATVIWTLTPKNSDYAKRQHERSQQEISKITAS